MKLSYTGHASTLAVPFMMTFPLLFHVKWTENLNGVSTCGLMVALHGSGKQSSSIKCSTKRVTISLTAGCAWIYYTWIYSSPYFVALLYIAHHKNRSVTLTHVLFLLWISYKYAVVMMIT